MSCKFKIYPTYKMRSKQYYEVIIFSNYKNMYEYYKETGGYQELDFAAVCRDLEIYNGKVPINKIGEILITIKDCKQGIITHECGHAVFQYMRKIMKDDLWDVEENLCWKGEEMFCQILGDLTKQFVNNLYKYNILDETTGKERK